MNGYNNGCGGGEISRHRGSYEDYDHSDEEMYVYDQCCRNCRYFRQLEFGFYCTCPELSEFDSPSDNGSNWCENWKGVRR